MVAIGATKKILAQDHRAVTLSEFIAEPLANGQVHLGWATGAETDTDSFSILRAVSGTIPVYPADIITLTYNASPVTVVPAAGTAGGGATYVAFDEDVTPGQSYHYVIIDTDVFAINTIHYEKQRTVTIGDVAYAGIAVSPNPSLAVTTNSQPVTHTLTVTNTGNRPDVLFVRIIRNNWTTNLVSDAFLNLEPGESATTTIRVIGENAAGVCASDIALVEFKSTQVFSSTFETTTEVRTRLQDGGFCTFLPTILK